MTLSSHVSDFEGSIGFINYEVIIMSNKMYCDAPNPGGPLTTCQPMENLCVSYYETHI